jgi:hypothetical protein
MSSVDRCPPGTGRLSNLTPDRPSGVSVANRRRAPRQHVVLVSFDADRADLVARLEALFGASYELLLVTSVMWPACAPPQLRTDTLVLSAR